MNDMSALGRRGYQACVQKYGSLFAFERARSWRLEHPSDHEQFVIQVLDELGVSYEREARILGENVPVAVDFHLPEYNLVIEVNGHVHVEFDQDGARTRKEQARLRRIEKAGYQVLVVDHRDLEQAEELIEEKIYAKTGQL